MCITLRQIRAALLRRLATGEPVEIGEIGPRDAYPPHIAQSIGPMVAHLHRLGIIAHAGATYATRPTRRHTVARLWLVDDLAAGLAMADDDDAYLATHLDDDDPPASGMRQLTLF